MSMISDRLMGFLSAVLLAALAVAASGCSSVGNPNLSSKQQYHFPGEGGTTANTAPPPTEPPTQAPTQPPTQAPTPRSTTPTVFAGPGASSMLRIGDMITVSFSDVPPQVMPDVRARITEDGMLPLHQNVRVAAAGKTIPELEKDIRIAYVPRFFRNLTAIVRAEERFYYVGGEVRAPNRYPLQGDMTVLRAIETAGGFTDFASRRRIELRRQDGQFFKLNENKIKVNPMLDLPVLPNDHIVIRRRWF